MTKRLSLLFPVTLSLMAAACTYSPRMPAEGQASQTQSGRTKGTLLVQQLPAGVEGLALVNGELKVQEGYDLVQGPDGTLSVIHLTTGEPEKPTGLGCGCSGGTGGCVVANQGGIAVCKSEGCTGKCGLAVTTGGTTTELIRF